MDVDQTYNRYVANKNIDESQLPMYMQDRTKDPIVDEYGPFTLDDEFKIEHTYTANRAARKQIVDQGRRIENALDFADKVVRADIDARNTKSIIQKGSKKDVDNFFDQLKSYTPTETYSKPSFFIDFTKTLGDSESNGRIIIG
jgi:hypothetical protein